MDGVLILLELCAAIRRIMARDNGPMLLKDGTLEGDWQEIKHVYVSSNSSYIGCQKHGTGLYIPHHPPAP